MLWIERIAVILGVLISLGTLLTVTLPRLRQALVRRLFPPSEQKALREEVKAVQEMLKTLLEDRGIQKEVDLCVLRDLITAIYYRRVEKRSLRPFELEDACALYELYCKRGGNSYVHTLFDQMTREWDVEK